LLLSQHCLVAALGCLGGGFRHGVSQVHLDRRLAHIRIGPHGHSRGVLLMLLMPPPWPPGPLQSNVREASKVHASKSLDAIEAPSDRLRFCSFCRCWLRAERHYHRRGAWDMRRLRARAVAVQLPCRCQQCAEDMHRAVLRCVTRCRIATLLAARGCAVQRSAQRSARGVRATWTARQLVSQRVSLGSKWPLHESRGCETVRPAGLGANLARARAKPAREVNRAEGQVQQATSIRGISEGGTGWSEHGGAGACARSTRYVGRARRRRGELLARGRAAIAAVGPRRAGFARRSLHAVVALPVRHPLAAVLAHALVGGGGGGGG
jgi:hypothetical protein